MSGARSRRFLPATALTALALALLALLPLTAEAAAPGTPDSVTVDRANGALTASWDAVDGATHYHVTYSTDNGTSWHAPVDDHTNIQATSLTFAADNDETYIVGVRAKNADGGSLWRNSEPAGPHVPPPPPSAVASVAVARADGSLTASWDAVDGATKHHVTYTTDNGASWSLAALEHPSNSIAFDVNNANTYVVGVRAGNDGGWSGWVNSPASGPYTPPTPTPTPARGIVVQDSGGNPITALSVPEGGEVSYRVKLTAAPTEDVEVCIGLSVRDNDDSDITFKGKASDVVSLKLTFTPGNWSTAQTVTLVAAEDDADDVNGARDVTHDAREYYSGKVDITATEVDNDEITPPAAPTGLTAIVGGGSVTLSWDDPADASITGYQYRVNHNDTSTGNLSGWGDWQTIADGEAVSHTLDGLTNGREYRFKLHAVNAAGAGAIAPAADPWFVAASPLAPAAPSNLAVTPDDDGDLTVSWDAVSGATGYDVRSTVDGSSWTTEHSNVSGTSVSVANANGDIEQIGVRARNAGGAGPWAELSRTPPSDWLTTVQQDGPSARSVQAQNKLAAPAWGTLTRDNRPHRLHLNWTAVQGASGYNVACSDSDGWSWWQCGSVTSGTTTSLTIDKDTRNNTSLAKYRSYKVSVRAVTGNSSEASDWAVSANIRPVQGWLGNLAPTRTGGSTTLSWTPNPWTTGYEVDCAVYGQTYTRCATLTGQDDTASSHSVTISSWTVGGTDYTIDDGQTYDIRITSTNQWGSSEMLAPLIGPIPNVSNLGEASDTFGQNISSGRSAAVGFTTGSNSGGYTLQGVTIGFLTATGGRLPSNPLTVAIHAVASGDPASSATYTLSRVHGDPKAGGNVTYSCSGTCSLSKDTTYFLMLATSDSNNYRWDTTTSGDQTNSTNFGWSIADGLESQNNNVWSTTTWSARFRVSATPDPSLDASNIGTTTARITVGGHTGQWWYKADSGPHATCQGPVAAGTAYKDLTGLTAGGFYVYSAYSESGCADDTTLASAEVATAVTVSNLSAGNSNVSHSIDNYGQGFTTGDADATLLSATVQFGDVFGNVDATVSLRAAQSNGKPATTNLATLTGTPARGQQSTFTCADGGSNDCSLDANTKYFIYVSGSSGYLVSTDSNTETLQPAGNGWSIEDALRRGPDFNLRGDGKAMKIEVEAIPHEELTASSVTATGATLTLKRHIGDWYYKSATTGQTTCTSAGSASSVTLSGLTAGTSYVFSAYSDSTCTTGNLLATAAQFIPSGSVSNLSAASDGFGVGVEAGLTAATGFTIGPNDSTLWSVTIKFRAVSAQAADSLTVAVHADSGGNPAASATHALTGSDPTGAGEYTYTCSGGCSLDAGETYFLVLKGSASTSFGRDFTWDTTSSASETNTPSSGFGWSIADKGREHNGSSWSEGFWTGIFKVEASAY